MTRGRGYTIDVIAGDGIGPEVMPAAVTCVDTVASALDFTVHWRVREWGSDHFRRHGRMMPVDGIDQLASGDAILLGAVGDPEIPDDVTLWGLLIPIRRDFEQYVNLRPVRTLPGVESPLRAADDLDMVIVRENVEGEYSQVGGRIYSGRRTEMAIQEAVFTRTGIERVARFATELAGRRSCRLISATKSNGIIHTMPFWDEVVASCVEESQHVTVEKVLVDALAARMVINPRSIDVVVASNLFGDILSDLAAAAAGSIGVAPSANLNPPRAHPSMFEPVHGSAPDIAGQGVANPIGQIWAAALMLDHLGEHVAGNALVKAFESALADGIRTPDLGGIATTGEVAAAVSDRCRRETESRVDQ